MNYNLLKWDRGKLWWGGGRKHNEKEKEEQKRDQRERKVQTTEGQKTRKSFTEFLTKKGGKANNTKQRNSGGRETKVKKEAGIYRRRGS